MAKRYGTVSVVSLLKPCKNLIDSLRLSGHAWFPGRTCVAYDPVMYGSQGGHAPNMTRSRMAPGQACIAYDLVMYGTLDGHASHMTRSCMALGQACIAYDPVTYGTRAGMHRI